MDENANGAAFKTNDSRQWELQLTKLYINRWIVKNPASRNMYVDPDSLEIRSQYWEHVTIIPILGTIMLAATVFLLILFRQSPALVAGTVAACLTIIGIYLSLTALNEGKMKLA